MYSLVGGGAVLASAPGPPLIVLVLRPRPHARRLAGLAVPAPGAIFTDGLCGCFRQLATR